MLRTPPAPTAGGALKGGGAPLDPAGAAGPRPPRKRSKGYRPWRVQGRRPWPDFTPPPPAPRAASPAGPCAPRGRDCGSRSAPPGRARAPRAAVRRTRSPRCRRRDCRSARRRAAASARWPARGRSRPAAARRPRACPADAARAAARPNAASSAAASRPRLAARAAGDHLRQHDVLKRGELAEQVMGLIDKADRVAADRGALGVGQRAGIAAVHQHRARHPASPAAPQDAAASICRLPDGATSATISPAPSERSTPRSTGSSPPSVRKVRAHAPQRALRRITHGAAPPPGRVRAARQLG